MEVKDKILVICGPTATGKTALALKLAKIFNGEIVSADSRQVYKYMDIGTGKDLSVNSKFKIQNSKLELKDNNYEIGYFEIKGVPIWLYDVVEPDYQFTVADYVKCANFVIDDIYKRGKLPIIVGGTGFYIKALTEGIETLGVKPDWKLRKRLLNCSIAELLIILKELNFEKWQTMNESDRQNPRRLVRAIEIAKSVILGSPAEGGINSATPESGKNRFWTSQNDEKLLMIGLNTSFGELYQRIDQRVDERVKNGVVEEIRNLLAKRYNFENSALGVTIGYKEWKDAFRYRYTESEIGIEKNKIIQRWKFNEHEYARRQMTWFKKDPRIKWFDITKSDLERKIEKVIDKWYNHGVVIPAKAGI